MSRIVTTEQTLIERIILNDTDAFEDLYRHYWYSLYLYCLKKLQSPEDAKIVVRTIFIHLWEKRHSLPVEFSLSQFLYDEVRKTVVKQLTKRLENAKHALQMEDQLLNEFSARSLQAARRPVTGRLTVVKNPSGVPGQKNSQAEPPSQNAYDIVKWILQSLTNKLSISNLSSYPKN